MWFAGKLSSWVVYINCRASSRASAGTRPASRISGRTGMVFIATTTTPTLILLQLFELHLVYELVDSLICNLTGPSILDIYPVCLYTSPYTLTEELLILNFRANHHLNYCRYLVGLFFFFF